MKVENGGSVDGLRMEAQLLVRSLERKFGTISKEVLEQVMQLDFEALLDCIERLGTAKSVYEVLFIAQPGLSFAETCVPNLEDLAEGQSLMVQTQKGWCIAGTRLTVYDVLFYVRQGWSGNRIQQWLRLSDRQLTEALQLIAEQQSVIEADYQAIIHYDQEKQTFWLTRGLPALSNSNFSAPPGREVFWDTLHRKQAERRAM